MTLNFIYMKNRIEIVDSILFIFTPKIYTQFVKFACRFLNFKQKKFTHKFIKSVCEFFYLFCDIVEISANHICGAITNITI